MTVPGEGPAADVRAPYAFPLAEDQPGWNRWVPAPEGFNAMFGPVLIRREGEGPRVRLRAQPDLGWMNPRGVGHGGAIAGYIDSVGFLAWYFLSPGDFRAATVDLQIQYLAPVIIEKPVDAVVEITKETGKLVFASGRIEQENEVAAAFMICLRKIKAPR
ncbi:PaaI family thioesterase [Sphingomonas sp. ID0503]|uniref:PaaI family thioesterase n=1 Tax=Sphingomonas sp. ID0503 TaxID=3399691 RepID=UPI003AFA5D8A